jgi:thioredoxin 1
MTKQATTATFENDVLNETKTVLVDFWAEWCGPCKMVAPILDQMSVEFADKIEIVKVNVDENPELSEFYRVSSIPTMMVFQGGEPVKTMIGAKPKPALVKELEEYLG